MTKQTVKIFAASMVCAFCAAESLAAVPADAAGDLAAIATISVQAKANLSNAALGGNVDEITEAGKRSDAVDAAMAQGQDAYLSMERADQNGDQDAVASASEDLKSSLAKAVNALNGVIPDEIAQAVARQKKAPKNTGVKGRSYDVPNVYDVPWNSDRMRDFYQNHFANFWDSGIRPQDSETTPE